MVAVGLSYLIVGDATIYTSQLPSRADSPAHRYRYSFPLLSSLRVGDAITRRSLTLAPETTVAQAERALTGDGLSGAPVVASDGALAGVMTLADAATIPAGEWVTTPVSAVMTADPVTVLATEGLDDALEDLATTHVPWMPVVDAERRVLGVVTAANITAAYRAALTSGVRRLDALAAGTALLEMTVAPGARVAGKTLAAAHLPRGVLVVSLRRDDATVIPRGDSELRPGDVATVVVDPRQEAEVRASFGVPAVRLAPALS
jgi:CIC family chloride channel protein